MNNKFSGKTPSLKNSKSVGQQELQSAKQDLNNQTTNQGMTSSVPTLNTSNAVGQQELQNTKQKVQKSKNESSNNNSFQ
ncbi:hypothetical protein [Natronincola ferrireducens]|uniref:Uncharacterized protein n=1 Tax=Natronincola ferrireducens TaxID=393762 RepID=A0A1G8ZDF1_9FIRM|nr:hypothetical protein [Natronincola ferrireducens]SDK13156.1 hypothetical protein SAMN05660472_00825 [Natronincola ferrireducens]